MARVFDISTPAAARYSAAIVAVAPYSVRTSANGAEAVARWSERSGRQPEALGWYAAMSTFKLACMLEGVYVRQSEDPTREASEFIAQLVLDLIARARRLADAGADW